MKRAALLCAKLDPIKSKVMIGSLLLAVQVMDGFDLIQKIENSKTNAYDKPVDQVTIADCGEA